MERAGVSGLVFCAGGEVAQDELLEDAVEGVATDGEEAILEGQLGATVGGWVVEIGDGSGGEIAEDSGDVWLAMAVIATADDGPGDRVEETGMDAARSLVEVAWILVEEGRQNGSAHERAGGEVAEVGTEALAVAGGSLAVTAEGVGCLLNAGGGSDQEKVARVLGVFPGEAELLRGGEGRSVPVIADKEVGKEAEETLGLFELKLLLGGVGRVGNHLQLEVGGGDLQGDGLDFEGLAGEKGAGGRGSDEALQTYGEREGAGSNLVEGEVAVAGGEGLLRGGAIGMSELDVRAGDERTLCVDDEAGDVAGSGVGGVSGLKGTRMGHAEE